MSTVTVEPMFTLLERFGVLTTVASERMRLISAMRASIMPCSFFASSYSEFSEMSPNSRATLMRSPISARFSVSRKWSSSSSLSLPSCVRMKLPSAMGIHLSLSTKWHAWLQACESPICRPWRGPALRGEV